MNGADLSDGIILPDRNAGRNHFDTVDHVDRGRQMINIEDFKISPVGPDELRESYEMLRRHCRECYDSEGCGNCKMQRLCRVNLQPRYWPEFDCLLQE